MDKRSFLFAALFLNVVISFASAQVVIPAGTANNIASWIGVPAEYLGSPKDIIVFVVIPFVIAALIMHGIWKEIGIFNNGAANFWIPVLMVFASFQFGFFKFVKALYGSTQSLIFAGAAIVAYVVTAKVRQRVGSFGYTGIFSGVAGYALDAVGLGIFFGGMAGALSGGRFGPVVYVAASIGVGLGVFLVWWGKRGKGKQAKLSALLGQYDVITKEMEPLQKKLVDLEKKKQAAIAAKRNFEALDITQEMVLINNALDGLKADREAISASN